jgi:hypothetical protein
MISIKVNGRRISEKYWAIFDDYILEKPKQMDQNTSGYEPEIEITPEMIDAGVDELCASELDRFTSRGEIVTAIFRAMSATKKPRKEER